MHTPKHVFHVGFNNKMGGFGRVKMTPQRGQIPVSAVFARARVLGRKKEKESTQKRCSVHSPKDRETIYGVSKRQKRHQGQRQQIQLPAGRATRRRTVVHNSTGDHHIHTAIATTERTYTTATQYPELQNIRLRRTDHTTVGTNI